MTHMEPFQAWKYYLALKLHFTTEDYDIVKNKGRVRASKEAFEKRRDVFLFKKLVKIYKDEEIINFLVSNFVSGDKCGGIFDSISSERYTNWKKHIESLSYNFNKDLDVILEHFELDIFEESIIFHVQQEEHPYIIRGYMAGKISLETLVILDKIFSFREKFDREIKETFIWTDISKLIKKYRPFIKIDREKYNGFIRRRN